MTSIDPWAAKNIATNWGVPGQVGPTGLSGLLGQIQPTPNSLLPFAESGGGGGLLGGVRSFGSSLGSIASSPLSGLTANPEATGLARFMAPEMTTLGAASRLGGYGLAGSLGSNLIDATNIGGQNSNLEQGLQGLAQGAGIGAGVGSIVPGIGTGLGALIGGGVGGAVGVLSNIFGGGGKKDTAADGEEILGHAITTAGLDDATTAKIVDTYEVLMQMASAEDDGKTRKQMEQAALDQAGQMVLQAIQSRTAATTGASNALALQAAAAQTFAPIADDIRGGAAAYGSVMNDIMSSLPQQVQPIAQMQMARELTSADRLANAYAAQAQMTPVIQQLTQYQKDQQNLAAQQFSQLLAQQAAGTGTGGASDVLAALGATG